MAYRIVLINMPFAMLRFPSIALAQLTAVVAEKYSSRVALDTVYLNQDFAHYIGLESYQEIAASLKHHTSGVGDWFFRQAAFPALPDNAEQYFKRYYPRKDDETLKFKNMILRKREGLLDFLDSQIELRQLDQADLVGFTTMFAQNVASLAMARRLKSKATDLVTVIGGANCEFPMGKEIARNADCIDFVFSGPSLRSFPEFVGQCLSGDMSGCDRIRGVLTKGNAGQRSGRDALGAELDIDRLVRLDYDDFLTVLSSNFPNGLIEPDLPFETSRGCWWGELSHCTFCGLNGSTMAYRAMEPDNALAQFESLFSRYSHRCSEFSCVDNILPKSYIKEVFPRLDAPKNVSVFYEVKADLTEDDLRILARAHVNAVQPGIESLSTPVLKLMRKGTSAFQNLRFLKGCIAAGVRPFWNLLVGFPGETEEVYEKYMDDIPHLFHLPPPSGVYPVRFDRFSPYYFDPSRYGLDLHPFDFYGLTYPFEKETLTNLAYYFSDHNLGSYAVGMAKWIDRLGERVEQWRARWIGQDNEADQPRLTLTDSGNDWYVSDSRYAPDAFRIGDDTAEILLHLDTPRRVEDLSAQLVLQTDALESSIALLKRKGLLFEEGGRLMSLCLKPDPSDREVAVAARNQIRQTVRNCST